MTTYSERAWHVCGGAALALIGAGFALGAMRYDLGTITDMGPGFLPFVLGIGLAGLGALEAVQSLRLGADEVPSGANWTATAWVGAAMLAFGFLIERVGFDPAVFVASFLAMMSERPVRLRRALIFSLGIALVADVLFIRLLSVSATAFGG